MQANPLKENGGRYMDRTCDPYDVNVAASTYPIEKSRKIGTESPVSFTNDSGQTGANVGQKGYIYFFRSHEQRAFKIGYTRDIGFRLSTLQTGNPAKLSAVEAFRGSRTMETKLHRRFRPYRISNEWFRECRALWNFLEDLEDIMVAMFVDLKVSGQLPNPMLWHELDIPEDMILACGR